MIVSAILLDFLVTSAIAILTAWFFTSRYLARRTSDHLGRDDVQLMRDMVMVLVRLEALDELRPDSFTMPTAIKAEVAKLLKRYQSTKELPG